MNDPHTTFLEADLSLTEHQRWVVDLLNAYAMDAMGDGRPLTEKVRRDLIPGLRRHPTTFIMLACQEGEPVGVAVCFRGFSTFAARPLLNIHDFFILPPRRGRGLGKRLLQAVEARARETGCCKLTLEVMEKNHPAKALYSSSGFAQATYVPEAGAALFYVKGL